MLSIIVPVRNESDNLEDLLHELNREVRLQYEEEDEGILESIKRTFANDSETDSYIPYDFCNNLKILNR